MKKLFMILSLVFLLCFTFGCQKAEEVAEEPVVDVEAEEAAVLKADSDWLKSVSERDIARVLEYYHEDAVWLIPKVSMSGKDEIRKFWERDFAGADYGLAWEPTKVEVSQSGDLAYTLGRWSFEREDKEGNTETLGGAYVAVWRKEPNGKWKLVIDIHNKGY
jgi:ketosteroid isomerase-like protein